MCAENGGLEAEAWDQEDALKRGHQAGIGALPGLQRERRL